MKNKLPTSWPHFVKAGNSSVPIYRREFSKKGRDYVEFKVVFKDPTGMRRFESFADFTKAKQRAGDVAGAMHRGEARSTLLSADQTLVYRRAASALTVCGIPLDIAAVEYAEARKILGPSIRLNEAATFFAEH